MANNGIKALDTDTDYYITGTQVGSKRGQDSVVIQSVLPSGAATSSNQTNGSQRTVIVNSQNKEVFFINSAFSEQLVSELSPQWQQSFEYTVSNTDLNINVVTGSGTVTQSNAMAIVSSGTTIGSKARIHSTHHAKYKAGLGAVTRFSALFSTPVAGTYQYAGLVDEEGSSAKFKNGLVIGYNGTNFTVTRFQNDATFEVLRADFDDKLDGTGQSGVSLDFTKLNVFYIQYQYLGAGNIYFWAEDPNTGVPFIFHTIKYANTGTSPSTHNPNYHMSLFSDNGATTSDIILKTASYGFFIEGRTELIEIHQPQNTSGTKSKSTITTEAVIFSIKNKAIYASKTNFIDIILERLSASIEASSANNLGTVRIVKNATIGGSPSYADINTTNSIISIDTSGTTVTGGTELLSFELAGKNDRINENLLNLKFIIHPNETITIAGSSANSATIKSSILWKELF